MFASVLATLLAMLLVANAQGIPGGIEHGASVGIQSAGPIGASWWRRWRREPISDFDQPRVYLTSTNA